ncbi:hypothetical protein [Mycobacteroides abscessus]|uniref:hypothetical protein n=1 Tax=Mycobacteroides abscessus TaxID=36809 RepID=UPI00266CB4A2|nr:hypothetical protein [Mycobacteroides abscessus]MDO3050700.1 hypothetical protein [Mycobacteroides abscessus subsp. abscessus]
MSHDFLMGLIAVPVVVAFMALMLAAIAGLIWASAKVELGTWKLWPKKADRPSIAATMTWAKSVRYFWIPGWHIAICRTGMFNAKDKASIERHRRVQWAVRDAMEEKPDA